MTADLRLVLTQTHYQLASIARNRRAIVLGGVFPVLLLVMFNSIFTSGTDSVELSGTKIGVHAYFTGGMLAYAIMLFGFSQLALGLVNQREGGQLKRLRGTPVPAWTFIVATALRAVVMAGVMVVILLAIADAAYGVTVSGEALGEVLLYAVLGTATMCSLGIAATAIAADVDSASATLPFIAVLLALISGVFVGVDQLPGWLAEIGRIFPLSHLAAGLQTAIGTGGATFHAADAAILAGWGLWGTVFAARHFSWEPRRA
jgi:ABC-2 type transport system permease protein